ncbi:hypothetical protein HPB50_003822 [Hyalomma asiaticum]|uniref:Uncharacterized protein n=1 Tax=Hyalomma asiaticum TaxID=266040 RepID=A0ACB7TDZ9_HYAAI|nr:hypothetical protein HPB50_003822 [Hyalomma asiaticum]
MPSRKRKALSTQTRAHKACSCCSDQREKEERVHRGPTAGPLAQCQPARTVVLGAKGGPHCVHDGGARATGLVRNNLPRQGGRLLRWAEPVVLRQGAHRVTVRGPGPGFR